MPANRFSYSGFNYEFPSYNETGKDNVFVQGQEIPLPKGRYFSLQMLASSESGMSAGSLTAKYADGSTSESAFLVPAWWNWPYPAGGDLIFPHFLTNVSENYNRSNIFQTVNWLDSSKELTSLTLPEHTGGSSFKYPGGNAVKTNLHVFAMSVLPAPNNPPECPQLEVQYARSTQKWMEKTDKTQIVEVLVNNVGAAFVLRNHKVRVRVDSPGLETVSEGVINRLRPGDQAKVEVGVRNSDCAEPGDSGSATVAITGESVNSNEYTFDAVYGIARYEANYESVYSHETPNWYNDAKYGIFIHWGLYSVPGWGNSGDKESYAEWYYASHY